MASLNDGHAMTTPTAATGSGSSTPSLCAEATDDSVRRDTDQIERSPQQLPPDPVGMNDSRPASTGVGSISSRCMKKPGGEHPARHPESTYRSRPSLG